MGDLFAEMESESGSVDTFFGVVRIVCLVEFFEYMPYAIRSDTISGIRYFHIESA